jgi:formylmethanofuran dehydrogenase subunit B
MQVAKAVTCPVCGCLCDDIELVIDDNCIIKIKNGCAMSESKFMCYNGTHRILKPLIRQKGKLMETDLKTAVIKAAGILGKANYPLLYGWSSTSCEATRVGIELAEEIGAAIDNTTTVCHGPSELSVQNVGIATCTLGQIRHRADLVIYWGSNPWTSHPRHIERYTAFAEGRFEKSEWRAYLTKTKSSVGRKKIESVLRQVVSDERTYSHPKSPQAPYPSLSKQGKKLVVFDVRRTRTAEIADYYVKVEPNKDYELLQALRLLVRDEELDVDSVAGVPVEYLEEIADAMINCSFGVIFFGLGLTMSRGTTQNVDAALSLTRDLNMYTKFMIMPMRGHFNVTGADTVLTWETGYPYAVDFSMGYPRYNPGETSAVDILANKESDATLVVASDPVSNLPRKAVEHLVNNPLIVVDPHMNATSHMADVVFPAACVGIEATGTAYRMDHVPLLLKKVVEPPKGILTDVDILNMILTEVRRSKTKK